MDVRALAGQQKSLAEEAGSQVWDHEWELGELLGRTTQLDGIGVAQVERAGQAEFVAQPQAQQAEVHEDDEAQPARRNRYELQHLVLIGMEVVHRREETHAAEPLAGRGAKLVAGTSLEGMEHGIGDDAAGMQPRRRRAAPVIPGGTCNRGVDSGRPHLLSRQAGLARHDERPGPGDGRVGRENRGDLRVVYSSVR